MVSFTKNQTTSKKKKPKFYGKEDINAENVSLDINQVSRCNWIIAETTSTAIILHSMDYDGSPKIPTTLVLEGASGALRDKRQGDVLSSNMLSTILQKAISHGALQIFPEFSEPSKKFFVMEILFRTKK